MQFHSTSLPGVWLIELESHKDARGHLVRTFCEREFAAHELNTRWPQCNATLTRQRGMLRGLHYQADPQAEIKLVRCVAGKIWDVVVDLRSRKWEAFELSSETFRQLYIPTGFAHGFQCLTDHCEVFYQMSDFYVPELARGIRYNDPTLAISWPIPNPTVSVRDQELPLL